MNSSLRELSDIEYGASPKEIRADDKTSIGIYGTGGFLGHATKSLFNGPLVVVARKGTLDNPIYVRGDCWVIDTAFAVLPKSDVEAKWLYYQLSNYDLKKLNESTGVPSINREYLYRLSFNNPGSAQQRKIARILSATDEVIGQTEEAIEKLRKIKQGMRRDLFTRGIDVKTGKLRPEHAERPDLYKASEIGFIPKEWGEVELQELLSITTGDKDTQDSQKDGLYPFFVRSQVIERINSFSFDGEAILTAGDGVGTGKIYHYINGKFDFHQRVYMLHNFSSEVTGKYIFYYFKDHFMKRVEMFSAKNTVDSVRRHMISEMKVPKPSKDEQNVIVDRLSAVDSRISYEDAFLAKILELKQGLMQDILTGRVPVVPDPQDKEYQGAN